MREFLLSQLAGASGFEVVDLCLDRSLVADLHPDRFTAITGMELLPHLEVLSICDQALAGLAGLQGLIHLRKLSLRQNAIAALHGLAELPALQTLDLSHNQLEVADGLERLTALEDLDLGFNELRSVEALAALPLLRSLVLNGNRRLAVFGALPATLAALHLGKCFVHDFAGAVGHATLATLTLSPGGAGGMAFLPTLPALTRLHLQAARLAGALALPPMLALKHLRISNGPQVHAMGKLALPQLEELVLQNLGIVELPDLRNCERIVVVELKHLPIATLTGLVGLPHLRQVRLAGTAVMPEAMLRFKAERPDVEVQLLQ